MSLRFEGTVVAPDGEPYTGADEIFLCQPGKSPEEYPEDCDILYLESGEFELQWSRVAAFGYPQLATLADGFLGTCYAPVVRDQPEWESGDRQPPVYNLTCTMRGWPGEGPFEEERRSFAPQEDDQRHFAPQDGERPCFSAGTEDGRCHPEQE